MACVYKGCSAAGWNGWNSGGVGDLCQKHYNTTKDDLEKGGRDYQGFTNDYIRLFTLMLNCPLVLTQLQKLNNEMDQKVLLRTTGAKSEFGKLSTALSYYETRCWFPNIHIILFGLLGGDDFLKIMKSGYLPKDVGAGAQHGEFSHRLQWHAVMRIATNDFSTAKAAGWDHTPYELYVRLGEKPEIDRSVWGVVFDSQFFDPAEAGFRDPSKLNYAVRTNGSGNLGLISTKVMTTFRKRIEIDKIADSYTDDQKNQPQYVNQENSLSGKAKGQFQKQKSDEFQNAVLKPSYLDHKGFRVSTQEQKLLNELHAVQSKSNLQRLEIFFNGTGYNLIMEGAMIRSGETLLTPNEVAARVFSSKTSLCSEPFP